MNVGARIKELLETEGWSQKQLAELLGSPQSTVSQWIKGHRTPERGQIERLAVVFNVAPAWIEFGTGTEPSALLSRARQRAHKSVEWILRAAPVDGGRDGGNANQFTIRPTLANLVREAIQNALDEWLGKVRGPVRVEFRLLSLRGEAKRRYLEAMHWDALRKHMEACIAQANDQQVAGGLAEAVAMADSGELLVLQISDTNTRGLIGPETETGNFAALTRDNLYSEKNNEQAGGSYGLGKAMQYAASAFGCVLFASNLSQPEPETEKTEGRFFARAELVYHHMPDGKRYSGPMWLGKAREGSPEVPISYWADGPRDALLRDLQMTRGPETGTTIAIVGMRDLDADQPRAPRNIVADLADSAERHFWPAIEAGLLEVRAQYLEITSPDSEPEADFRAVAPEQSPIVGPFVSAVRAYANGEVDETLIDDGDVVRVTVPLRVPARRIGDDQHSAFVHNAVLLVRRATDLEESDDASRRELRRAVLYRGSHMVVKSLDLSRGLVGVRPFQAIVLAGLAAGGTSADARAEVFLRASEPPSHDDWEYTPRLRRQYAPGARKALIDFEYEIRRQVKAVLQVEFEETSDGPRDLGQRFHFGEPTPAERAPRVLVTSQAVDDDGSWRIEGAVRLRGDLRRATVGRPQLIFLGESGARARVAWTSVEGLDADVRVRDDQALVIPANTRTARFRAISDASTHPAPASQSTAVLTFQPLAEEML